MILAHLAAPGEITCIHAVEILFAGRSGGGCLVVGRHSLRAVRAEAAAQERDNGRARVVVHVDFDLP
jgi:hypothetical protein